MPVVFRFGLEGDAACLMGVLVRGGLSLATTGDTLASGVVMDGAASGLRCILDRWAGVSQRGLFEWGGTGFGTGYLGTAGILEAVAAFPGAFSGSAFRADFLNGSGDEDTLLLFDTLVLLEHDGVLRFEVLVDVSPALSCGMTNGFDVVLSVVTWPDLMSSVLVSVTVWTVLVVPSVCVVVVVVMVVMMLVETRVTVVEKVLGIVPLPAALPGSIFFSLRPLSRDFRALVDLLTPLEFFTAEVLTSCSEGVGGVAEVLGCPRVLAPLSGLWAQ